MSRDIKDILLFRSDISPFLVHLTRKGKYSAKDTLEKIITERKLIAGDEPVSDARFVLNISTTAYEQIKPLLKAVCLTETPLNEVHCLLEIKYRKIKLERYGLAFLKNNLRDKGVSPVLYFNNHEKGNKDDVFEALYSLAKTYPQAAGKFLSLIAVFGYHINQPLKVKSDKTVDFLWEREWRYPSESGDLKFTEEDIFVGLCPHNEIDYFENKFNRKVEFIDPMRNIEWYASKLVRARKRLNMKHSVV